LERVIANFARPPEQTIGDTLPLLDERMPDLFDSAPAREKREGSPQS
jgi:hypothetical protein